MRPTFSTSVYATPLDFDEIQEEWRAKGFGFGVFRDPTGQEWNDFVHQTDEYVIVAEGTLTISVGQDMATCCAGDLVWIPKGVPHSLKTTSPDGSVWLYGYGNDD